jgi:hypothetical protein
MLDKTLFDVGGLQLRAAPDGGVANRNGRVEMSGVNPPKNASSPGYRKSWRGRCAGAGAPQVAWNCILWRRIS